jgi:uncharacterized protein YjiK
MLLPVFALMCVVSDAYGQASKVGLDQYELAAGPIVLKGVEDDASGVTYCGKTRTLFVVLNDPPTLVEVSLKGEVKRRVKLEGFEDTEDVVWMETSKFAVVEERRAILAIFELDGSAKSVSYDDAEKIQVDPVPPGNLGLEGVAYDAGSGLFTIVKEKQPLKIYGLKLKGGKSPDVETSMPWEIRKKNFGMTDLSSVAYDAVTGHLLILSDESKCLVECTLEGEEISRLSLMSGDAGLTVTVPQPEGVALDAKRNLYICSEPNQLYVFAKVAAKSEEKAESNK